MATLAGLVLTSGNANACVDLRSVLHCVQDLVQLLCSIEGSWSGGPLCRVEGACECMWGICAQSFEHSIFHPFVSLFLYFHILVVEIQRYYIIIIYIYISIIYEYSEGLLHAPPLHGKIHHGARLRTWTASSRRPRDQKTRNTMKRSGMPKKAREFDQPRMTTNYTMLSICAHTHITHTYIYFCLK